MRYHEVAAPAPLYRRVRCFWFLTVDGGGPQPVVPDGRLEVVLHRAEPFGEVGRDGVVRPQETVLVSGQLTRPIVLSPAAAADVVGIRFRTAGARAILGLPLGELTDRVVALRAVAPALVDGLAAAAREADAVRALSRVLLDRLRDGGATSAEAVARLERGECVAEVARALRMSVRTLERRVRDDAGLPPKVLQRVMRFRRLYALLQAGDGTAARAAAAAGYFDQTHANRDFRRFTGTTPRAHFRQQPELTGALLSHPY
jgi:AraC-like DNA-binding protein